MWSFIVFAQNGSGDVIDLLSFGMHVLSLFCVMALLWPWFAESGHADFVAI